MSTGDVHQMPSSRDAGGGAPAANGATSTGRADQQRTSRGWLRVLGVVVAAGALVGAATVVPQRADVSDSAATAVNAAERAPLHNVALACPESRYADDDEDEATTDVGAVATPAQLPAALDPGGKSRLAWSGLGRGGVLDSIGERQRLAWHPVRGEETPPLLATASGSLAPGVSAGQVTRATDGELRGLAETPCVRPKTEFWFAGTGSDVGRHGRLHLTNVDATPARVDLSLYDENGRVSPGQTDDIVVQPFSQRTVPLEELAPTSKRIALGVKTSEGRVAAALRDDNAVNGVPRGVDWLPPSTPPAKKSIVPGVAPDGGNRVLTIAAPGESSALVRLSVLGRNSTFTPNKNGTVEVPPGKVVEVPLDSVTAGEAGAVQVNSDVPVVSGVRSDVGGPDGDDSDSVDDSLDASERPGDMAHSAAASPLNGPAVVPLTEVREDSRASLLLTGQGSGTAKTKVTLLDENGKQLSSSTANVTGGRTTEHKIDTPDGVRRYSILVEPPKGSTIYGVRLLEEDIDDGPLVSTYPLSQAPTTYVRPAVRPAPDGGL